MAVVKIPLPTPVPEGQEEDKVGYEINNGDYQALKNIVEKWEFKDVESALRFGIAALVKASETKEVGIVENGKLVRISPAESLLSKKEVGTVSTPPATDVETAS